MGDLPSTSLPPKCLQQPVLDQSEARLLDLSLILACEWQEPKSTSYNLLPPRFAH